MRIQQSEIIKNKKKNERSVLTIPSKIEKIESRQNAENMPLYFNCKIKTYALQTCGTWKMMSESNDEVKIIHESNELKVTPKKLDHAFRFIRSPNRREYSK